MNNEPWREDAEDQGADSADEGFPPIDWRDPAAGFIEQILRGSWPIRVPFRTEISIEGKRVQVRTVPPGQEPSGENSQVLEIVVQFSRWKVRDMIVEQIRDPQEAGGSKLPDLTLLARVDRACFLETAAAHFAELLADGPQPLLDDCLADFLHDLHEFDEELIADVVSETKRAAPAAGAQLRDAILDQLDRPEVREHLGWLATAAITQRLQDL